MATRITYHQINLDPKSGTAAGTVVFPHAEGAVVSVVGAEFAGGGGDGRYMLHVVVVEPCPDEDAEANGDPAESAAE